MGNYISCTLSAPIGKHYRGARVIFPTGEIRQFQQPIKAAEIMLDTPNFFLVNSKSLRIGRRFSALSADEDLDMANLYIMFPMKRLNSVIAAADLGALFLAAKRASAGKGRISPENGTEAAAPPRLSLGEMEELSSPVFKHKMSMCRSKKPLLETIAEERIC